MKTFLVFYWSLCWIMGPDSNGQQMWFRIMKVQNDNLGHNIRHPGLLATMWHFGNLSMISINISIIQGNVRNFSSLLSLLWAQDLSIYLKQSFESVAIVFTSFWNSEKNRYLFESFKVLQPLKASLPHSKFYLTGFSPFFYDDLSPFYTEDAHSKDVEIILKAKKNSESFFQKCLMMRVWYFEGWIILRIYIGDDFIFYVSRCCLLPKENIVKHWWAQKQVSIVPDVYTWSLYLKLLLSAQEKRVKAQSCSWNGFENSFMRGCFWDTTWANSLVYYQGLHSIFHHFQALRKNSLVPKQSLFLPKLLLKKHLSSKRCS